MFITLSRVSNAHTILKSFTGHGHVNVTAQIRLRDHPETIVEDSIYRGTGIQGNGETTYESYLSATGTDISWDEKFKICISEDIAPKALLVFKFNLIKADLETTEPEVPIGVAALVLSTKGLFASDGEHRMKIRKLEPSEPFEAQLMAYLHEEIQSPLSSDPVLTVESFLCSTRFTEDNTLHSLLHWKTEIGALTADRNRFQLKDILRKFTFVSEIEILKVWFLL